ncbi:SpoIIE family protein phosphatase, partial [Candidatus Poribacteria bacterium]|nr:SpoIIE family protein phosphatase [Candidatus Poribacteria bacterium]
MPFARIVGWKNALAGQQGADKPPRLLFPFWLQLILSFFIFAGLTGLLLLYVWARLQAYVEGTTQARHVRTLADLGANLIEIERVYEGPFDLESRRANKFCAGIADFLAGTQHPNSEQYLWMDRLQVSIVVPQQSGWTYWLSSEQDRVGQPYHYSRYLDAYLDEERGWDNFATENEAFVILLDTSVFRSSAMRRLESARGEAELAGGPPPREGVVINREPITSARPLARRIEAAGLGAIRSEAPPELGRAVLVIEAAPDRVREIIKVATVSFVFIFVVANVLALGVALLVTWRMNRPISKLHEAMVAVGAGNLDCRVMGIHSPDEFGRLAWQFNRMMSEFARNSGLAFEVGIASRIQRELIPDPPSGLDGLDVAAWYATSQLVGGDYYDFVLQPEYLWISIGDAVGHGVDSGIIMASARSMVRALVHDHDSPREVMTRLNRLIGRDLQNGNFFTAAVVRIHRQTFEFVVCSAGHEPVLWRRAAAGTTQRLLRNGPPLGVVSQIEYPESRIHRLEPGDVLLLSTDGVRECHAPGDRLFGKEGLNAVLEQTAAHAADVLGQLKQAIEKH